MLSPLNAQTELVIQLYLLSVPQLDQNLSWKYPFARWSRFLIPLPSFHAIHFSLDHLALKDWRAECPGCGVYSDSSFIHVSMCRARWEFCFPIFINCTSRTHAESREKKSYYIQRERKVMTYRLGAGLRTGLWLSKPHPDMVLSWSPGKPFNFCSPSTYRW